jgi:hypothetical protein
MARSFKAVCPFCGTEVKPPRKGPGLVTLMCPQCSSPFKINVPATAAGAASTSQSVPVVKPEKAVRQPGISWFRLAIVVVGALLFVAGGAALTAYCLQLNSRAHEPARTGDSGEVCPEELAPRPPKAGGAAN